MYRNPIALTGTLFCAAAFAAAPASAQEAERTTDPGLAQEMVETRFPGFLGGSRSGWSTRFDPQFNPAIGFILDTVWIGGGEDLVEGAGGLDLRTAELDIASRIDPLGWAYAVAAFEGDEFELEEAALFMDRLPANLSLRAGRYLADFGKWNTIHLHDKSYVFEDGVRESVFGGNLNVEGVELHQWGGIGDLPFRWSFGVATGFGGHGHGHEEEGGDGHGSFGQYDEERSTEQWAYTGRFTVQHDVGQNGYFQWGASGFHTNGGLLAEADTNGDGEPDVESGVGQTTLAVDLTLRMVDASALTADTVAMELWYTDREALAEPSAALEDREALGLWGFYQHDFDPHWGAGVMAGWWQEPGESTSAGIFERDEAGAMRAAYVDWRLSEFNRLRLQLTQFVPDEGGSAWAVALQWDVILGSHSHPLDF